MGDSIYKDQRSLILVALCFFICLSLCGCSGVELSVYFERGALATASPIATAAGIRVFQNGGNAFDVAVAVGFVLQVVHPEAGNIGGGGFAMIRDGQKKSIHAFDFRETAPLAATTDIFLDPSGEVIPEMSTYGARACGVPGTVAGLYDLWKQYGTLPWDSLVQIAAALADSGFIVDEYLASSLADYQNELLGFQGTADIYFPDGNQLHPGDRLVQKDLAKTLYLIATEGKDGFYNGETADKIVACMDKHGGLITREDLEAYAAVWREPVHLKFDSLDIYSMPPPSSGGIVMGQILKLAEPYDWSTYSSTSPAFIHLFSEASRLAFADRSRYLGDPDFYEVPAGLLDSLYLETRRSLITPRHAAGSNLVQPGEPARESDQTTHFSVCDDQGNMVAFTYTLNTSYGSKLVVDGAGFLLNNEMDDFSVKPGVPNTYGLIGGEANKIEPGKRMLSSMSPTLVLRKGQPYLALGAPGGSKIITVVAQAIAYVSRFGLSLTEAVHHPRFHHQWLPDVLYIEENVYDITVKQELIRYGYHIEERPPYSDLQAVYVDPDGLMLPVSDPRKNGLAGGL